jgi:hypothetical protein
VSPLRLVALLALSTACCTQGKPPPGDQAPAPAPAGAPAPTSAPAPAPRAAAALPRGSGVVTARGGETIELDGARITVVRVTYLNEPCPPGMQCLHSGILKQVEVRVLRGPAPVLATVVEGQPQVVDGVQIAVRAVRPGPEADLEASLPVAPVR